MLTNVKRAKEYMQKYELEGLIATTPTDVSYLTDFDCWAYRTFRYYMAIPGGSKDFMQSYAILTPTGERLLVAESVMSTYRVDSGVELRPYGGEDAKGYRRINNRGGFIGDTHAYREGMAAQKGTAADALVDALQEKGVRKGRVGIELDNVSSETRSALKKRLPDLQLLDCTHLIRLIRMVKTEEEIERLRKAQRIGERAMVRGLSRAKVGGTFGEILHAFKTEVAKADAVTDKWNYWANGYGLSESYDARIVPGVVTGFDGGCSYKMYYCDTGTSLVVGRNRAAAVRTHSSLFQAVSDMVDSMRAGVKSSEVMSALSRAGIAHGVERAGLQGHGIGLESREHPVIKPGEHRSIRDGVIDVPADIPLEAGMVLNIETPLYVPGKEAYQVERCFLVRKKSPLELTPHRSDSPFIVR